MTIDNNLLTTYKKQEKKRFLIFWIITIIIQFTLSYLAYSELLNIKIELPVVSLGEHWTWG